MIDVVNVADEALERARAKRLRKACRGPGFSDCPRISAGRVITIRGGARRILWNAIVVRALVKKSPQEVRT